MRSHVQMLHCERCQRKEPIPVEDKTDRSLYLTLGGEQKLRYEDLCSICLEACKKAIEMLSPTKKLSPKRTKKASAEAPQTSTNGSGAKKEGQPVPHPPAPMRPPRS